MEELHSLTLELLNLVQRYQQGIKKDMNFSQARELRKEIMHLQKKLETKKTILKFRTAAVA